MFVLRTALPTQSLTATARAAIQRIDPGLALYDVLPMDMRVRRALGPQRASMVLTLEFAGIAVALAAIGVYGLLAWTVARRIGEIGVRMAIGAQAADILKMVMKQGARMILVGLVIGTVGTLGLGCVLASRIPKWLPPIHRCSLLPCFCSSLWQWSQPGSPLAVPPASIRCGRYARSRCTRSILQPRQGICCRNYSEAHPEQFWIRGLCRTLRNACG